MSFLAEVRAELGRLQERVALLERVIDFYEGGGMGLNGAPGPVPPRGRRQKTKAPRATVAKETRTRAGAAEAAQARSSAQPVETEQGTPPSAPRSPAKRAPRAPRPADLPSGQKWCGTCETAKPVSEFAKDTSKPDRLQIRCRPCSLEAGRRWRAKQAAAKKAGKPSLEKEEAEPVRALEEKEELETETETETRRTILHRAGQGGELAKQEHAARVERIARRVAARKNRRHGRKQDGAGNGPFMRCLFQRAPQTVGDTVLALHSVTCGAVVIAGDEADHLEDVHGLVDVDVAPLFAPIPEAAEGGGQDGEEEEDLGLGAGFGG